jgi:uncharacterized protein involved in tolerance to divalent cations
MYNISNMGRRKNDVNSFNDFLDNANNVLSCDANCQERKKKTDLKTKYLEAKTNLLTAPTQVETSYKNYLTYTKGDSAYSEYKENELKKKAEIIVKTFKSNFNESIEKIKESYDTYVGLLLNFSHVVELYKKLVKENKMLELEVKNKTSDALTNDRKTYYEDQSIDTLKFYHRIILVIYIICLIVFAVSIFVFPSASSKASLIGILVFFIIYPFICIRLFNFSYYIRDIIGVFPSDVYKDI